MQNINLARVIGGGVVAGLTLTFVADTAMGLALSYGIWWLSAIIDPIGHWTVIWQYGGINIALGVVLVWLYAAIRPRFGPGVKTAVVAGVAAWIMGFLIPVLWIPGPETGSLAITAWPLGYVASLFGVTVATLGGAWVYQEDGEA